MAESKVRIVIELDQSEVRDATEKGQALSVVVFPSSLKHVLMKAERPRLEKVGTLPAPTELELATLMFRSKLSTSDLGIKGKVAGRKGVMALSEALGIPPEDVVTKAINGHVRFEERCVGIAFFDVDKAPDLYGKRD